MRLAEIGLGAPQLSAVLLTHLHSDHITDLNDVITTRWVMSLEPAPLTHRRTDRHAGGRRTTSSRRSHLTSATASPTTTTSTTHRASTCSRSASGPIELAGRRDGPLRTDGPQAGGTEHRASVSTHAGAAVVAAGDTVPCARARRAVRRAPTHSSTPRSARTSSPTCRCSASGTHSTTTPHRKRPLAPHARAASSTLVLTHYVPPIPPGDPATTGGAGGRRTSAGASRSATTCTASRSDDADGQRRSSHVAG